MTFDLSQHAETIYRYAHTRCFKSSDAEDLAQEIMLQAWMNRKRIESSENMDPYLAGICRNTFRNWLRRKKHEPQVVHLWLMADDPNTLECNNADITDCINADEPIRLRRLVSNLAGQYRELLVGHYYEGKSIRQLSEESLLPEGTIKWRLMTARQSIKKEWTSMEPIMRIKPIHLNIQLSGSIPPNNPVPQMTTAVRSSLLWALQKPMTVKEVSENMAIPAMYIEEELKGLLELEAVCKLPGDRYGTDFIIQTLDYQAKIIELSLKYAPSARKKLFEGLEQHKDRLLGIGFDTGETPWEELRYSLLLHMVHDSEILWENVTTYAPPLRPDGSRYYFMCKEFDKTPETYGIHDWYGGAPGVQYRTCSMGNSTMSDSLGTSMNDITSWCTAIHETGTLDGIDKEVIARLIAAGLIKKESDRLKVAVPWFAQEQFTVFIDMAKELSKTILPEINSFRNCAMAILEKDVSPHQQKHVQMQKVWSGFDFLREIMRPIWPEDSRIAAGLLFVKWNS